MREISMSFIWIRHNSSHSISQKDRYHANKIFSSDSCFIRMTSSLLREMVWLEWCLIQMVLKLTWEIELLKICFIHVISKLKKISLTSKLSYFMDPPYVWFLIKIFEQNGQTWRFGENSISLEYDIISFINKISSNEPFINDFGNYRNSFVYYTV